MIAAIAPPADIPATYTLPSVTSYSFTTCLVMPAMSDGSPRPRCWGGLESVPALLRVGVASLRGIRNEERVLLGELVHARAGSEVVRTLGATMEHDDQGNGLPGVAARDVKFVGASPCTVCVRTLDEKASSLGNACGGDFPSLRTGRELHAVGEQGQPRGRPRSRARSAYGRMPGPPLGSRSNETGDYLYRLV